VRRLKRTSIAPEGRLAKELKEHPHAAELRNIDRDSFLQAGLCEPDSI
jgi:hypothetical protein